MKANKLEKHECSSDAEAKHFANTNLTDDTNDAEKAAWPVAYFKSDTTGEKAYEEFYVPGEKIDMNRFASLGVVEHTARHTMDEVDEFFGRLEGIFEKEDFTKAQVVEAIKEFIPNFAYEEKGKNLDQKM